MIVTLAEALEKRRAELECLQGEFHCIELEEKGLVKHTFLRLLKVELPDEVEVNIAKALYGVGYEAWLSFPPSEESHFSLAGKVVFRGRFLAHEGRVYTNYSAGTPWRAMRYPVCGGFIYSEDFNDFLDAVLYTEAY